MNDLLRENSSTLLILAGILTIVLLWRRAIHSTVSIYKRNSKQLSSLIKYKSPLSGKVNTIPLEELVKVACPTLSSTIKGASFYGHPLLIGGHMQTLWASILADYISKNRVTFERETIKTSDGGSVSLDWTLRPSLATSTSSKVRPIIFICHGLTGGSHESYVQDLIICVKEAYGYESVVMNFRGCSGTEVKSPQLYSGSWTNDVKLCVGHIKKLDPNLVVFGVGFSLGASVITKFTGQLGEDCPFIGLCAVASPYDFLGSLRALHRSFIGKHLYSSRMGQNLSKLFQKHTPAFKDAEWLDMEQIKNASNIMEFDAAATSKQFHYKTVHEYYRFGSSAQDIPYITIPTLFLSSLDDPISNCEVIPHYEFDVNPNVVFASTKYGGHLGWFIWNWNLIPQERWFAKPVGEFIHAIIESRLSLPKSVVDADILLANAAAIRRKEKGEYTGTPWQSLPREALAYRNHFALTNGGSDVGKVVVGPAITKSLVVAVATSSNLIERNDSGVSVPGCVNPNPVVMATAPVPPTIIDRHRREVGTDAIVKQPVNEGILGKRGKRNFMFYVILVGLYWQYLDRRYFAIEASSGNESSQEEELERLRTILEDDFEGMQVHHQIGQLPNHFLVSLPRNKKLSSEGATVLAIATTGKKLHKRMMDHENIVWAEEQIPRKHLYKRETPAIEQQVRNALNITDPGFGEQWHLLNSKNPGFDLNVSGVWESGVTGTGVTVAFLDDGLDHDNPDLKDNFSLEGSYDFNEGKKLPTPALWDDTHGTRCAGEVAAVKNNVCGVGVAYTSKVAGIRILSGSLTSEEEAEAVNYACNTTQIYSCSWGPMDDGRTMEKPPELVARAIKVGVDTCRNGLGSIFVYAAGNGAASYDNCNFDGYTNSIYTITVASMGSQQEHPTYSESCSAVLITTYSAHGVGTEGIYTTDWKEGCSNKHGGTSASAPLAAGVYALLLSVRPDLNWRDVQRLTIESAIVVNPTDPDWKKNEAGRLFNHKYGYGTFDTYKLIENAKTYKNVGPLSKIELSSTVQKDIPEGGIGVVDIITISNQQISDWNFHRLENVQVTIYVTHQRRGDIAVYLTSPFKTVSRLIEPRNFDMDSKGYPGWTMSSVVHWDETAVGNWTLQIIDNNNPASTGKLEKWTLSLWGEQGNGTVIRVPDPSPTPSSNGGIGMPNDKEAAGGNAGINTNSSSSSADGPSTVSGHVATTGYVFLIGLIFITALVGSVYIVFKRGWFRGHQRGQNPLRDQEEDLELAELENMNSDGWNLDEFDDLAFTDNPVDIEKGITLESVHLDPSNNKPGEEAPPSSPSKAKP